MGAPLELAQGAIRVSLGRDTRAQDLDAFADAFVRAAGRIGRRSGRAAA
jgi:cysteine sulfinate desulfinase/cysteine desulfurase-like protein